MSGHIKSGYNGLFWSPHLHQDMRNGIVKGWSAGDKFGHNEAVGTTFEDIWTGGGSYNWLTAASTIEAISDNVADIDTTGSGARKIQIEGLDANWESITEIISMNGTTVSSPTTNSFIRVNRAFVTECGTYGGSNTGDITIQTAAADVKVSEILPLEGQSLQAMFTVPANKKIYIYSMHVAVAASKSVSVEARLRLDADNTSTNIRPWRDQVYITGAEGTQEWEFHVPWVGPPKTDLTIRAKTSSGTAEVSASYEYALEDI